MRSMRAIGRNLWDRIASCGGFVTRPSRCRPLCHGPIGNRPQVGNLPHIVCVLVMLLVTPLARADAHTEALDLIASMTAALSDDDAPAFLKELDKSMPGYDRIEHAIPELLDQGPIACSVQPLTDAGDDSRRTLDLDWYMEIRNVSETAPIVRRRGIIHFRIEKHDKHWRVTSLDPVSFFDPHDFTHR